MYCIGTYWDRRVNRISVLVIRRDGRDEHAIAKNMGSDEMIINYSYRDRNHFPYKADFTMIASRSRVNNHRVPRVKKYPVSILPTAAIYGDNGVGKSDFINSLGELRALVAEGIYMDSLFVGKTYTIEFLADDTIYELSLDIGRVDEYGIDISEKLIKTTSYSSKTLYDVHGRDQLIIHEDEKYANVRDWFVNTLEIIDGPRQRLNPRDGKVYICDNFGIGLNPVRTENMLDIFLQYCTHETRGQLIFATHETTLMDSFSDLRWEKMLRPDELWLIDKTRQSGSRLIAFSDYVGNTKVARRGDLRKHYRIGRMGGIPRPFEMYTTHNEEDAK